VTVARLFPPASVPRRRRSAEGLFVLGLLAAAGLLTVFAWGGSAGTPPRVREAAAVTGQSGTAAPRDSFDDGRRVFLRDCAWCHGDDGAGSELGPSLKEAGPAAAHFWLTTGRMPLYSVNDEPERGPAAYPPRTIDALVAYVGTLGAGPEVPNVAPGDVYRGRSLFLYNCAPCHSSTGTGMVLPEGEPAPELYHSTPTQVAEAIRLGPGPMPPFSDKQLDKEQADAIATYVQRLGPRQDIGGNPLDAIGPIYEGIVAWLVALPLLVLLIRLLGKKAPPREPQ
jgi:ubiquinol-cytochrome c reductase cytochrome c subunit